MYKKIVFIELKILLVKIKIYFLVKIISKANSSKY